MPPRPTCLFTGEELGADTAVEHTLPRVLGGRFRSTTVSSSAFNNACSNGFDDLLAEPYAPLFSYLDPLLSSEHRQSAMEVKGADGRTYLLHPGGVLGVKGMNIERRDDKGRPLEIAHEDPGRVRDFARQLGWSMSAATFAMTLPTNQEETFRKVPVLAPAMEVAALKSILLTFDHLLEGARHFRFTRNSWLDSVRAGIANTVMRGMDPVSFMEWTSWGLVNDEQEALGALRSDYTGLPECPFEHLLVASADPARGTLDVAWNVAGVDVWGFRVSKLWNGPEFTIVAGCGILRGCKSWGPLIETSCRWRLGSMSRHRACQRMSVRDADRITEQIAQHRHTACRVAVDHMERHSDELVSSGILTLARFPEAEPIVAPDDTSIARGVERRLLRIFLEQCKTDDGRRQLMEAMSARLSELPKEVRAERAESADLAENGISWKHWLACWRRILDSVEPYLGKPSWTRCISVSAVAS